MTQLDKAQTTPAISFEEAPTADRRFRFQSRGVCVRLWPRHAPTAVATLLLYTLLAGCATAGEETRGQAIDSAQSIDLQGHRGARGLLPENTVPSLLLAVDLGVSTVELDVVIASDSQVVVSHEPWFSHEICTKPDGVPVTESEARELNIFRMNYSEVKRYDCGSRGNERFPQQRKMAVSKPLLSDAIEAVERHAATTDRTPVYYNVEIKSRLEGDNNYHPAPATFARLVYQVLLDTDVLERSTIQSFDPRSLEAVRRIDSSVTLALLVDNELGLADNLARLSFRPEIYSPNYRLVDRSLVDAVHAMGVRVIPWTVNETAEMESLLHLGVDGIITDYPDRGRVVVDSFAR